MILLEDFNNTKSIDLHLGGWVPEHIMSIAVPLNKVHDGVKWKLHYREGFDSTMACKICDKFLTKICVEYNLPIVNLYLYCMNYDHDFTSDLNRVNCNNGYTLYLEDYFNIVIFREKLWPKVLIHEILHILWIASKKMRSYKDIKPKRDETIIEEWALYFSITYGYIDYNSYLVYRNKSRNDIIQNVTGGNKNIDFVTACLHKQKTHVYEYLFLTQDPFQKKSVSFI